MMPKDSFENRLGQGLKRWAQAGEPTLDLEAMVKARVGEADPEAVEAPVMVSGPVEEPTVVPHAPRKRRWARWLTATAAAAALILTAGATFPSWAGAASEWPLVGPVVKEMIMEDAGLKWAYDMGFIQQPLAEATHEGMTFRVLGVVADKGRTTVFYQITGWEAPPKTAGANDGQPVEVRDPFPSLAKPVERAPYAVISRVNNEGVGSWWSGEPKQTPLGLIGMVTTYAIPTEEATLDLQIHFDDDTTERLPIEVKRTANASREVIVNQVKEIAGVGVAVDSVVYTPAETIVRYRTLGPQMTGSATYGPERSSTPWLEFEGRKLVSTQTHGSGNSHTVILPAVTGPARLVFPSQIRPVQVDLMVPPEGATLTAEGVTITSEGWTVQDGVLQASFQWADNTDLVGLGRLELLNADGQDQETKGARSEGSSGYNGVQWRRFSIELNGVEPVAIRVPSLNFYQEGPWVFELPN